MNIISYNLKREDYQKYNLPGNATFEERALYWDLRLGRPYQFVVLRLNDKEEKIIDITGRSFENLIDLKIQLDQKIGEEKQLAKSKYSKEEIISFFQPHHFPSEQVSHSTKEQKTFRLLTLEEEKERNVVLKDLTDCWLLRQLYALGRKIRHLYRRYIELDRPLSKSSKD